MLAEIYNAAHEQRILLIRIDRRISVGISIADSTRYVSRFVAAVNPVMMREVDELVSLGVLVFLRSPRRDMQKIPISYARDAISFPLDSISWKRDRIFLHVPSGVPYLLYAGVDTVDWWVRIYHHNFTTASTSHFVALCTPCPIRMETPNSRE